MNFEDLINAILYYCYDYCKSQSYLISIATSRSHKNNDQHCYFQALNKHTRDFIEVAIIVTIEIKSTTIYHYSD